MPLDQSTPIHAGTPYFMGEHALVKFSSGEQGFGPETYWLVDKKMHTVRPFESHEALQNAFGAGYDQAMQHMATVIAPNVSSEGDVTDGVLKGFNILSPDYSIKEDGTSKKLQFSPHQLKQRYGKPIDMNSEGLATEVVDGLIEHLKKQQHKTGITPAFLDGLKKDHHLMAFYISAMAYGKYHLSDVYHDISHRFHAENKENKG
jgi:hypothetical protein